MGKAQRARAGVNIDELSIGATARIVGLSAIRPDVEAKLREIGFCEGDEVELLTRGPLSGQPLAVRLNRRIIAMRGEEARAILVEPHFAAPGVAEPHA